MTMIGSGFERRDQRDQRDQGEQPATAAAPKVRVYELAKELGIPHRDLVARIRQGGVDVANHMSQLEGVDADRLRRAIDRERHETLVEERLTDTVIRRRSRTIAPPAAAPKPAAPPPPAVKAKPVESPSAPAPKAAPAPEPAPEPVKVKAPPPAVAPEVEKPEPAPEKPAERPRMIEVQVSPLTERPAPPVTAVPTPEAKPAAPATILKTIPQPVVTGSAATGQFIQLPGMGPKGEPGQPHVVIKDRDEELRRMGRAGLLARNTTGRDWRSPGGPGQGRPGGPPKKRVAAAGKKLKQTQITTPAEHKRVVRMAEAISVSELAQKMGIKGGEVVKKLWALGMMGVNINQNVDQDTASLVAQEFGFQIESTAFREESVIDEGQEDNPEDLVHRAPVVTIMGHVDHGKTSLLDAIRKANVAGGEAGGITQHIGAYRVGTPVGDVVFLDTPGHEAFTAMRARGAQMTDIVVLVVAADDGPMPQTIEALNHAKAAEVPIMVAVNKIDKPGANPAAIRTKFMEHGLVPEEFGGETIFIDVSAKTKQGIDKLLELLALQAEVLELKANPKKAGKGAVIEARLDRGRGPIATLLVKDGTLKVGDIVVAGETMGKIRAMLGDKGQNVGEAAPATPVEVLGLDGVPDAGDNFAVVEDEKDAKSLVEHRRDTRKKKESTSTSTSTRVSLENILDRIKEGEVKEVKIILKADVQGSVEALANALRNLSTPKVGVNVITSGVGGITESDVTLAKASSAIVIGFNVRPAGKAQSLADQEGVDLKLYQIIYDAIDDVKKAMVGMLSPVNREKVLGRAEVRQVYHIAKAGTIAGCSVTEGKISRRSPVRIVRDSVVAFTGKIGSLKRFKDDASEVEKGYECGLTIDGYNDIKEKDVIESFEIEQIAATLDAPTESSKKS